VEQHLHERCHRALHCFSAMGPIRVGPDSKPRQRQSNSHIEADRVSDGFSHLFPHGILPTFANKNSQAHEETNESPNGEVPTRIYFFSVSVQYGELNDKILCVSQSRLGQQLSLRQGQHVAQR
jgi:hypothetical protein